MHAASEDLHTRKKINDKIEKNNLDINIYILCVLLQILLMHNFINIMPQKGIKIYLQNLFIN